MKEDLITLLEATGYPAYQQGSIGEDEEYPESFFTIWNFDTPETHYDNNPVNALWGFWISFYSSDPALVESVPAGIVSTLRAAGWIVEGKGEDALSDEKTHTGRRITAYYRENY